jgi:hypothetical protein
MSDDSNLSAEDIKDLINEVTRLSANKDAVKKRVDEMDEALQCTLKEFLSSFILIGYDLEGEQVLIRSEENQMQSDALKSFLLKYVQMLFMHDQ